MQRDLEVSLFTERSAASRVRDPDDLQRSVAGGAAPGLLRVDPRAEQTTPLPGDVPDPLGRYVRIGSVAPTGDRRRMRRIHRQRTPSAPYSPTRVRPARNHQPSA